MVANKKGLASIEVLPLMIMFVVLVSFALGFFGVVHTGIVYSIHSRTYAFEALRNRANYNHMRDVDIGTHSGQRQWVFYQSYGYRTHGISSLEHSTRNNGIYPTLRDIKFPQGELHLQEGDLEQVHNQHIYKLPRRNTKQPVNPVWLMVQYGLCLNAQCKAQDLQTESRTP